MKRMAAGLAALCLGGSAQAAVIDYPAGSVRQPAITLFDNTTQLQVSTGTATQAGIITEIDGVRSFEKIGAGTLILTGQSPVAILNVVTQGILQYGNGGASGGFLTGGINNNAAIVFNRSDDDVYLSAINGTGTLTTIGTGTIELWAVNNYTGATNVNGGTLDIVGSIARSAVTVNSGGTLTGSGSVGAVTVASGGTLSPGNNSQPGTMLVQGNLTMAAGSNYGEFLNNAFNGIANVTGKASLNGTLALNFTPNEGYAVGKRLVLVNGASGLSGTFAAITGVNVPGYVKPTLSYDANNAYLTLVYNALTPQLAATGNRNQKAAAGGIDAAVSAGGVFPANAALAIFGLSGNALGAALTQSSGVGADVAGISAQAMAPYLALLTSPGGSGGPVRMAGNFAPGDSYAASGAPDAAQLEAGDIRVWGMALGGKSNFSANSVSGAPAVSAGLAGVVLGFENQVSRAAMLGVSIAGGTENFSAGSNGKGRSTDLNVALYGQLRFGSLSPLYHTYVSGAVTFGKRQVSTTRTLAVSGTDTLNGKFGGHDIGGRIETGYDWSFRTLVTVTPFAAYARDSFHAPAYGETASTGNVALGLRYAANDVTSAHVELGARLARNFAWNKDSVVLDGSLAWAHRLDGDALASAAFQTLPGSSFSTAGVRPAKESILLGLGAHVDGAGGFSYGLHVDGQLGQGTRAVSGLASLGWRW